MQGEPWIDRIMRPLADLQIRSDVYNPIYEAVSRGNETQGKALIAAILRLYDRRADA